MLSSAVNADTSIMEFRVLVTVRCGRDARLSYVLHDAFVIIRQCPSAEWWGVDAVVFRAVAVLIRSLSSSFCVIKIFACEAKSSVSLFNVNRECFDFEFLLRQCQPQLFLRLRALDISSEESDDVVARGRCTLLDSRVQYASSDQGSNVDLCLLLGQVHVCRNCAKRYCGIDAAHLND